MGLVMSNLASQNNYVTLISKNEERPCSTTLSSASSDGQKAPSSQAISSTAHHYGIAARKGRITTRSSNTRSSPASGTSTCEDKNCEKNRCEVCGKTDFTHYRAYVAHRNVCLKRFECPYLGCGKIFRSKQGLLKHSHDKKVECPFEGCKSVFSTPEFLRDHLRMHKGVYRCDVCQKDCRSHWHLRQHKLIHSGSYPFTCQGCKKGFRRKNYCEAHEDECVRGKANRYYPCKVCGRRSNERFRSMQLCTRHAYACESEPRRPKPVGSLMACRCFDELERLTGRKIRHIHFSENNLAYSGDEPPSVLEGLPKMRCDGQDERGVLYEFHGNEFHGFRHPEKNKEAGSNYMGRRYTDLYETTRAKTALHNCHGYDVIEIWEDEWKAATKSDNDDEKKKCMRMSKGFS